MKTFKQAVTNVINDYILSIRMEQGLFNVLNSYSPSDGRNEVEAFTKYKGQETAFLLLGIPETDSLRGQLSEILWQKANSNTRADVLAESIFTDWVAKIEGCQHY